jgi:hypothetical protein
VKKYFQWSVLYWVVILFSIAACSYQPQNRGQVHIEFSNHKYTLYRNGHPFKINGGSGYTHIKDLKEAGGNTLRMWDTTNIGAVLDSAEAENIAVIVGLPMPPNDHMDEFYNVPDKVKQHYKNLTATVNRYKQHPALLCWCLGNELSFPYKPNYNKFYDAFNQVVNMAHHNDPNHPVTTTMINFQSKNITNIKLRTHIDFISFNIFGALQNFEKELDGFKWFWDGPFLVTEWGVDGPWHLAEQNAWGAFVENSSEKKAEQYLQTYRRYMPVNNPRFLGSLVFYWGQKQEYTPTWFSIFDEQGRRTEAYNTMQYIWTGKKAKTHAPPIKFMLINDKGGKDNLMLSPNTTARAQVYLDAINPLSFSYKWELLPEDWYMANNTYGLKKPKPLDKVFVEEKGSKVTFKVPEKEGPYRLFVYVYNKQGYLATHNIPFYVLNNP